MSNEIIIWNGVELGKGTNRVAMQWAHERIPRLIELGYKHLHGSALVSIAKHTGLDGGNIAWPSQKTIAAEIGMKERSISYAVDELELGEVIQVNKHPGKKNQNRYTILPETDGHEWKPWVTCKQCSTANGAILQTVQSKQANSAGSNLQMVQEQGARLAAEQEYGIGAVEQGQLNRGTTTFVVACQTSGNWDQVSTGTTSVDQQPELPSAEQVEPASHPTTFLPAQKVNTCSYDGPAYAAQAKSAPKEPAPSPNIRRPVVPEFPDSLGGRLAARMWHYFPSSRESENAATSWPHHLEAWVNSWPDHHLVTGSREQDFADFMQYVFEHPGKNGDYLPRGKGNSAAWLIDPDNEWLLRPYRADARRQKAAQQQQPTQASRTTSDADAKRKADEAYATSHGFRRDMPPDQVDQWVAYYFEHPDKDQREERFRNQERKDNVA